MRLTSNEVLFRTASGRRATANGGLARIGGVSVFACECTRPGCVEQVELWLAEYGAIRATPHRFLVAPLDEHVSPYAEHLVERTARYFVVESVGAPAADVPRPPFPWKPPIWQDAARWTSPSRGC